MAAIIPVPVNTLAPDIEEEVVSICRAENLADTSVPTKNPSLFADLDDCWHSKRTIAAICNQHTENMAIYI
jgi:hypothetical protein